MKFMPVVTPKERTALMLFFVLAVLSIASFFTLDGFGRGIGLVLLAGYAGWLVREGLIKTDDPADEWWLAFTLARISVLIVGFAAIAVFVLGVWFLASSILTGEQHLAR